MKLLHTGDWHLGKSLHEKSLLEDQRYFLEFLVSYISQGDFAALLICGDIYDRAVPSAEAVSLFSDFLSSVRKVQSSLSIFIIAGNHDSSQRLAFANDILSEQNIYIVTDCEKSFTPIIISHKEQRAAFFLLPFLASFSLKPSIETTDIEIPIEYQSQFDLAKEASKRFAQALEKHQKETDTKNIPTILVAHLFTTGGEESASERIFLGSSEKVPPSFFEGFTYVALGHLHRAQRVTDRMYYAGSPIAYAFDEAEYEKVLLEITLLETNDVKVIRKPIPHKRNISRLSGKFEEFYLQNSFDHYSNDYLEITLTDSTLVANPIGLLQTKFPYLLSIRQGALEETNFKFRTSRLLQESPNNTKRDETEDFCQFEIMLYDAVSLEKKELFTQLLSESKK